MKKMITLVLALVFMLGFASVATAMGPDLDPTNVGFVLTDFKISDQMLSPLALPNWSGAVDPNKVVSEGQPIWFVAHYVQRPIENDTRDFVPVASQSTAANQTRKSVFTAKDNTINWQFSGSYMNFVRIVNLSVDGGAVTNLGLTTTGSVSAEEDKLEVTMRAAYYTATTTPYNLCVRPVANGGTAEHYYLQIMAFTKACNEAQGTVYARTPVDVAKYDGAATTTAVAATTIYKAKLTDAEMVALGQAGHMLQVYDTNLSVKYQVVRYQLASGTTIPNVAAGDGDYVYAVYNTDNEEIIGFVSSNSSYKGMVKVDSAGNVSPVQWQSDDGGKWRWTNGTQAGVSAISDSDLKTVMSFFNFSFGNSNPILARHIEAMAGYWMTKEAKYNVAAAVITVPDGDTDPVPKTGDAASSMGLIMIAIALSGLAAVGFVVSKRVRG